MDAPLTPILLNALSQHLGQELTREVAAKIAGQVFAQCFPGPLDFSAIAPQQVGSYEILCASPRLAFPVLRPIHEAHWNETESHRSGELAFNPDYQRVIDLDAQGRVLLIVARVVKTGEPVGNYLLYVSRSAHTQTLMAHEDTLFVTRAHRKGRLGIALIRYAESALRQLGVKELNVSVKKVNHVGQMIERMGYLPVGTEYTKLL